MKLERKDAAIALMIFACGYLFWELLALSTYFGAGVSIFTVILCGATLIWFKIKGIKIKKRSLLWLGIVLVLAAFFFIYSEEVIRGGTMIALMGAYIYWVCVSTETALDKKLSSYIIGDGVNQVAILPFSNFLLAGKALKGAVVLGKSQEKTVKVLLGLAVSLPVAFLIIMLLSSADPAFHAMIGTVTGLFHIDNVEIFILKLILTVPTGLYLFGLLYGNIGEKNPNAITKEKIDQASRHIEVVPKITVYTALTIFNIVYAAFFLSQLGYLFSDFEGSLPANYTYADYAKEGFFQLCAVAIINFIIVAAMHLFTKKEEKRLPAGLRIETGIMCGFSVLLTIVAFKKMVMYVDIYGLTQSRVYTMCFMAALFAAFIIIGFRQFLRFHASRVLISMILIVILAMSYGNIDGIIAKYNIAHYEAGTLKELDCKALEGLSDGAVPYIYRYYQSTDDQQLKKKLGDSIKKRDRNKCADFRDYTIQSYKADQIRISIIDERIEDVPEETELPSEN